MSVLAAAAPGPRARECYFRAAYALLAECGYEAVTVPALCERVGVTKGSFYHHFSGLPDFVEAFAARWLAWVEHIVDDYLAEPDVLQCVELAVNSNVVLLTGAEPAIRAWAWTEPAIASAVAASDVRGTHLGVTAFAAITGDQRVAAALTQLIMSGLIGLQQRIEPVDPDRYVRMIAEVSRRCLNLDVEIDTFHGRTVARVRGRLPEPVPPYRPLWMPVRAPDGSRPLLDEAIEQAVAQLAPATDRGPERFFGAARQILAEQGSSSVTVAALCARVGISKGSFHHHFPTMGDFVAALAAHWEQAIGALIDNYRAEPDPLRRLELMFATGFALPHPTEAAWRAWGRNNPVVSAALDRQERRTKGALEEVLGEVLGDAQAADLMAEFGVGIAIGLQHHEPPLDAEPYVMIFIEWVRRCLHLEAGLVERAGALCITVSRPEPAQIEAAS